MKKDKYEDAAERLLINGQYKLIRVVLVKSF